MLSTLTRTLPRIHIHRAREPASLHATSYLTADKMRCRFCKTVCSVYTHQKNADDKQEEAADVLFVFARAAAMTVCLGFAQSNRNRNNNNNNRNLCKKKNLNSLPANRKWCLVVKRKSQKAQEEGGRRRRVEPLLTHFILRRRLEMIYLQAACHAHTHTHQHQALTGHDWQVGGEL